MDQHNILYNCVVWLCCFSQHVCSVDSYNAHAAASRCCLCLFAPFEYLRLRLDRCLSLSRFGFCLYIYLSISFLSELFLLVPTDLPGTLALNCSLSPSHSPPSHIFSPVSRWARQGVPGVTLGVMSSWSRVRKPGIQHPLCHPPLTPCNTQKRKKKNLHSYRMLSPQREIVLERQGSRAEVQMKRA